MNKGFLRGELLIKVCIFPHSPSPAHLQIPAEYLVGTSCYVNRTHCCAPQWSKHWCWGICQPFELEDNDSSFTRIHRRRGTSIQRLQSFFIITSHVFADTLCSIYRANVSLGAQKQLTGVQQLGILSTDHLDCRILGGRGAAFTSAVVESVHGLTFPIRTFLSSHLSDNNKIAWSSHTFVGVFMQRPSTTPLRPVPWPR